MRRSLLLTLILCAPLVVVGCGGGSGDHGGGGGGGSGDGGSGAGGDGGGGGNGPDAGKSTGGGTAVDLGATCDPTIPQPGGCKGPKDICTTFDTATNAFCSTECTPRSTQNPTPDPACTDGYTGPGFAGCWFTVTNSETGTTQHLCGVVCRAPANQCPADKCDGTCPGDLQCKSGDIAGVSYCM